MNSNSKESLPRIAKKNGCLYYLFIGIIIFFVLAIFCIVKFGVPETSIFSAISNDISIEQSKNAEKIFNDIGVEKIIEAKFDELLSYDGLVGFRVNCDGINLIAYFKDGSLYQIKFAGNMLYNNGTVTGSIKDYTMTIDEQSRLELACQRGVKAILKAPSTATFPSITEWAFDKNKQRIVVQSYVDAQNSFGAKLRSRFQFVFTPDGNKLKSFIFDGKEYIK